MMTRTQKTLMQALSPLIVTFVTLMFFWIGDKTLYPLCVRFKNLADRAVACPLVLPQPLTIVAFLIAFAGLATSALRLYRYYLQNAEMTAAE